MVRGGDGEGAGTTLAQDDAPAKSMFLIKHAATIPASEQSWVSPPDRGGSWWFGDC